MIPLSTDLSPYWYQILEFIRGIKNKPFHPYREIFQLDYLLKSYLAIVVYFTYTGKNRRTMLFRYEQFIQILVSVLRHEERDTILTMLTILSDLHPNVRRILRCLRSLSVEIRKTQLHLQRPKSNSQLNGRELNFLPPWSNLNFQLTLFQNPSILRNIFSEHDVIHTLSPFSVWGLLSHLPTPPHRQDMTQGQFLSGV